jgi:ribosome assembly protein 1
LTCQDHGKTSLSDALIATNGIISPKMAGKIRYLDSRPDEQLRGITMESSAISLCFSMARRPSPGAAAQQKDYLINLIDSPGHVDFSSEVSTASRLCDGAVVLVDAVEGVCSQTVTVLRQVWIEHMKPILVVNKVDRLIWELKMSAGEAYTHLSRLVEEVNAVLGSFFQGERMEEDLLWREKMEQRVAAATTKESGLAGNDGPVITSEDPLSNTDESAGSGYEEKDDESIYFAPENNNIIFSSAVDGWAFTVRQFASLYEKKLGIRRSVLEKYLWGDYYLDSKTKRVLTSKHLKGRNLKPMFVQLVLENVWAVYEATTGGDKGKGDATLLEKITRSLSITIPAHVARSRDPRALMTTVFSSWLPLSTAVLVSVIEHLPSPPRAQAERLPALIDASPGFDHIDCSVRDSMISFKTSRNDPAVAYVSKMVSVPTSELPQNKRKAGSSLSPEEARELARKKRAEIAKARAADDHANDGVMVVSSALGAASIQDNREEVDEDEDEGFGEPEQLVGFARLYSGTLSVGDSVYVLPPKFSPAFPHAYPEPERVTITALYLLMGRSLEPLISVPAGVVFGIGGLEGHILKSGTICSQLEGGINLAGMNMGMEPIVRVALEPVDPGNLGKMIDGMKMLEQSDPCAQYEVLESGEHVILTAGELHLERCLKDLRERFARCEIQAGEPIVPFRETIIEVPDMAPPKVKDLPRGTVISLSPATHVTIRLRVKPLPPALIDFLDKHSGAIRRFYNEQKKKAEESPEDNDTLAEGAVLDAEIDQVEILGAQDVSLADFRKEFKTIATEDMDELEDWVQAIENTAAFGPRRTGPNLLVDVTPQHICNRL